MNPQMLMGLAGVLGTRVIPALDAENYAAGDAKSVALLLVLLAQDADRAADRLVSENAAMRGIFSDATAAAPSLAARMADAVRSTEADMRISTLQASHDRLTELLIELHGLVEEADVEINHRIWAYLGAAAEARALFLPEAV